MPPSKRCLSISRPAELLKNPGVFLFKFPEYPITEVFPRAFLFRSLIFRIDFPPFLLYDE